MQKNNFGKELKNKRAIQISLNQYKNFMLYNLDNYLFHPEIYNIHDLEIDDSKNKFLI